MKKLVMGILAHVDAGKTTLSEGLLYTSGMIRKMGRVDHQNTFLDNFALEKERGITIFSKQARLNWENIEITLLDTPGHVDFSTEMERTLQVLDYAILVISGIDGVQGHTKTLWRLLKLYEIPTFIFVNKMDLVDEKQKSLLQDLQSQLDENCIDFSQKNTEEFFENIAMCTEKALEEYMEQGVLTTETIAKTIAARNIFPVYFGSALKLKGIEEFMQGIVEYTKRIAYPEAFAGKVYKIARDEQNNRITYLKVTGGSLKVKMPVSNRMQVENGQDKGEIWEEKINQIRLYSGTKFETVQEVEAGTVCAVTGLSFTYPGENLGMEQSGNAPILEAVLSYQIIIPEELDVQKVFRQLKELEEDDPQLQIVWNEHLQEMHIQLMGEVQIEILKEVIKERFGYLVEFGEGNVVYKETITTTVEGVGHFEPLRHYAEVHLLLEPGEQGSGMQFFTDCSEDLLDKNWQRLILTHLEEKEHIGVLTGSVITDMKITLVAGKAHKKHTEGGDFRQATYRAIRQGLKLAESKLLEPYYAFSIELPSEYVGRALNDIQQMHGKFENPEIAGDKSIIKGQAPVATMSGYVKELNSYTHGMGRLTCELAGYYTCHNQEEVMEQVGYDSEADVENPTCSVFCAHGAGYLVPWNEVYEHMHIECRKSQKDILAQSIPVIAEKRSRKTLEQDEAMLEKIMLREFGAETRRFDDYGNVYYGEEAQVEQKRKKIKSTDADPKYQKNHQLKPPKEEYLLVDGYNIIFSWEELNELAKVNLDSARMKLMDWLCNYQGYKNVNIIVVFDAYKVKGNPGSVERYHNIHVVFTKEAETADMYIEKTTHEIGKKYKVTVATSDGLEQVIIMQQGANRMSATDLKRDMEWIEKNTLEQLKDKLHEYK